jgi:hypothetical protein
MAAEEVMHFLVSGGQEPLGVPAHLRQYLSSVILEESNSNGFGIKSVDKSSLFVTTLFSMESFFKKKSKSQSDLKIPMRYTHKVAV